MDEKILYDLVKETRQDMKSLAEKVNDHILLVNKQLEQANRPATFFTMLGGLVVKLGAAGGLFSIIKTMFENHGK